MQCVMVIGGPGSGKSTLARQLGGVLNLPVVHMDPIYWRGDWIERAKDEVMQLARAAADDPAWVIDGNHSASMAYRAERADTIIFLDLPRRVRMRRILWRTLRYYGRTRPDMGPNCPERFDREFLSFSWNYDQEGRLRVVSFLQEWQARRKVHHLTSLRQVTKFMDHAKNSGDQVT